MLIRKRTDKSNTLPCVNHFEIHSDGQRKNSKTFTQWRMFWLCQGVVIYQLIPLVIMSRLLDEPRPTLQNISLESEVENGCNIAICVKTRIEVKLSAVIPAFSVVVFGF